MESNPTNIKSPSGECFAGDGNTLATGGGCIFKLGEGISIHGERLAEGGGRIAKGGNELAACGGVLPVGRFLRNRRGALGERALPLLAFLFMTVFLMITR